MAEEPVNFRTNHSPSGWDSVTIELPKRGLDSLSTLRFLRPTRFTLPQINAHCLVPTVRCLLFGAYCLVFRKTPTDFTPDEARGDQVLQLSCRGEPWLTKLTVKSVDNCQGNIEADNVE